MFKDKMNNFTRKIEMNYKKFKKKISYLMFPDDIKCIFCGCDIPNFYKKPYCDECEKELEFNEGQLCKVCDMLIPKNEEKCFYCKNETKNFVKAFCPFVYDGKVKNAILSFKQNNKRYLAKGFAILIAKRIMASGVKIDKITFIPMTQKKEKLRGFNQAKLLAEELGKILDKPVLAFFHKDKEDIGQKNFNYKERMKNIVGAFSVKNVRLKKSENILIVDDVITTTATTNYCSGLLYPYVNEVYVCGIARTNPNKLIKNNKKIFYRINFLVEK